jgi:polyisoprenoid-binding protein YceI
MNAHAKRADIFDVEKYPTANFKGKVSKWNGNAPAEVDGQLTLKGVTKPLKLTINSFHCMQHPMQRREVCGADASAKFMRDEFGVDMGKPMFKMDTKLLISIEALKAD